MSRLLQEKLLNTGLRCCPSILWAVEVAWYVPQAVLVMLLDPRRAAIEGIYATNCRNELLQKNLPTMAGRRKLPAGAS